MGNIPYKDIVNSFGESVQIKLYAWQITHLLNNNILLSSRIDLKTGTAVVTLKKTDLQRVSAILGVSYDNFAGQADKIKNRKITAELKKKNLKLSYLLVTPEQAAALREHCITFASYPKGDKLNIAFAPEDKEKVMNVLYPNREEKKVNQETFFQRNSALNRKLKDISKETEQLDGIPKLKVENRRLFSTAELIELRDRLLKNMELRLREGGNEAFYSPTNDYVNMPMIERFDGAYSYMSTFLHESAHASGAKHRLNRDLSGRFGSESYAKEELRAEIASAFTASATGIKYEQSPTMENHAAYIQNWIKVLENNPNELFAAIKDAEKISDYLLEKGELIVKEPPEIADAEVEAAAEPTDENYRYREISYEDFRKLRDAGFDVADNCRQSTKHPDMVILRYTEQQAAEINAVLKPAVGAAIKK